MKKIDIKKLVQISLSIFILILFLTPSSLIARTPEAKDDFDVNVRKREPSPPLNPPYPNSQTIGDPEPEDLRKINVGGPTDNLAPQLNTLVGTVSNPDPVFTTLHTVKHWNSGSGLGPYIQADYTGNWGVTLAGVQAPAGAEIKVPHSGYTIDGENHQVTVLYATDTDVTIHYGTQDSIAVGYAIHLLDFNVSDELLAAYNENEANGRTTLISLPCGYVLGTSNGSVRVAMRDTGSFIDPRIGKDWWDHAPITSTTCEGEMGFVEPSEVPDQRPLDEQEPLTIACNRTAEEFHPLRPYPANACDPLIPQSIPVANGRLAPDYEKYITYSCGPQLQPVGTEAFDPYGDNGKYDGLKVTDAAGKQYDHTICEKDPSGLHVTCYRSSSFDITAELKDANLGILGNTQTGNLTDEQKVNEYLSYYLTGVPQVAEPLIDASQEQIDRVVNFSGPLRKLLPWDMQNSEARATLANSNTVGKDVHDYNIEGEGYFGTIDQNLSKFDVPPDKNSDEYKDNPDKYKEDLKTWRIGGDTIIPNIFGIDLVQAFKEIFNIQSTSSKLFQNIPLAGVEDIAGEFILTMFSDSADNNPNIGQHSANGKQTAPSELTIMSATKASGGPGSVNTLPTTYQPPAAEENVSCSKDLKIMAFGDSITVGIDRSGTGDYSPGGYRGPLKNNLVTSGYNVDMVGRSSQKGTLEMSSDSEHEGYGAQRASVLANIIGPAMQASNPNVVLIHVGTNNLTDDGVQEDIDSVKQIINSITSSNPDALIVLAKILPIPAYSTTNSRDVPTFNNALSTFDSMPNVVVVNMNSISEDLLPDGIHPNKVGYETMAGIWASAIKANCK